MKCCSVCKQNKPLIKYTKDKYRSSGLDATCKDCKKIKRDVVVKSGKGAKYQAAYRKRQLTLNPNFYLDTYRSEKINSDHRSRLRRAKLRKAPPDLYDYERILVNDPCVYCGRPMQNYDHIAPLVSGGLHDWTNLASTCESCNKSKGSKTLLVFMLTRM